MALLDAYGNPVDMGVLRGEVAAPSGAVGVRRPWTESVASGLTPARLNTILKQANEGDQDDYLTLAEEMEEREAHYRSVLQTRKLAVSGIEPQVKATGDDATASKHAEAVQALVQAPPFAQYALTC